MLYNERVRSSIDRDGPRLTFRQGSSLLMAALSALAAAAFALDKPGLEASEGWPGQFLFLLGAALACGLAAPNVKKRAVVAILLGFQAFLLAVADYPEGSGTLLAAIFASTLLLSALNCYRVTTPLLPLLGGAIVVVFRFRPIRAWAVSASVPALADSAFAGAAVVVFAYLCLAAKNLDAEARRQREKVASLNLSVSSLLKANLDFQNYALEAGERSTIAERKRLSRDIHDIVGYTLINLKMMLEAAIDRASVENQPLRKLLATACDQAQAGLSETRHVLRTLRDMDDPRHVGVAGIHRIINSFSRATGIEVETNYGNIPRTLGQLDLVISHIVQEGMTNAIRHGGATRIQIGFWIVRDRLHLKVSDNGVGAAEVKPGIGLSGMRERLELIGGELAVQSTEYGFSLIAEMPLPEELLQGGEA
jgi:signal transduction histidine kinase